MELPSLPFALRELGSQPLIASRPAQDAPVRAARREDGSSGPFLRGAAAVACSFCASAGSRSRPSAASRPRLAAPADSVPSKAEEDEEFDYGAGKDYWDSRYEKEKGKSFDWLGDYDKFREFIEAATKTLPDGPRSAKFLDLGCGNAKLAEEMYDDGFEHITALDISEVAIESMRERNAEARPGITWVVGDAFELELEDESFDVVIDKSTTDAVSCDTDHIHENMTRMYGEVFRVLKPGGTFLVFSSVVDVPQAALRLPHLAFDVEEQELYRPFSTLFAFTARKRDEAPRASLEEARTHGRALDLRMAEERRLLAREKEAEAQADERLKETAPSSFGVLD